MQIIGLGANATLVDASSTDISKWRLYDGETSDIYVGGVVSTKDRSYVALTNGRLLVCKERCFDDVLVVHETPLQIIKLLKYHSGLIAMYADGYACYYPFDLLEHLVMEEFCIDVEFNTIVDDEISVLPFKSLDHAWKYHFSGKKLACGTLVHDTLILGFKNAENAVAFSLTTGKITMLKGNKTDYQRKNSRHVKFCGSVADNVMYTVSKDGLMNLFFNGARKPTFSVCITRDNQAISCVYEIPHPASRNNPKPNSKCNTSNGMMQPNVHYDAPEIDENDVYRESTSSNVTNRGELSRELQQPTSLVINREWDLQCDYSTYYCDCSVFVGLLDGSCNVIRITVDPGRLPEICALYVSSAKLEDYYQSTIKKRKMAIANDYAPGQTVWFNGTMLATDLESFVHKKIISTELRAPKKIMLGSPTGAVRVRDELHVSCFDKHVYRFQLPYMGFLGTVPTPVPLKGLHII